MGAQESSNLSCIQLQDVVRLQQLTIQGGFNLKFQAACKILPLFVLAAMLPLHGQETIARNEPRIALPDAPLPMAPAPSPTKPQDEDDTQQIPNGHPPKIAPRLAKYIEPDQQAVQLSAREKLELAGWEQVQPYAVSTEILAAAWEHLLNGNPKYGSDKAGFGERVGAAAIRQTSQAIFSDGVLPAILRQDPRYYRKGSGKIVNRILYSASRVLIIRTDAGKEAPNFSQIIGYAGAAALTMTYYPAVSATWNETAEGYAISIATAGLGNQLHEFAPDLIRLVRHRHRTEAHAGL